MELLQEIARRQAEELEGGRRAAGLAAAAAAFGGGSTGGNTAANSGGAAAGGLFAPWAALRGASASGASGATPGNAAASGSGVGAGEAVVCGGGLRFSAEVGLATERMEVARLRQEAEWLRLAPRTSAGRAVERPPSGEERAAELRRWEAERARLEAALGEVRLQGRYAGPRASGMPASLAAGDVVAATARLQEEVAVERRAAAAAQERVALLRQEAVEARGSPLRRTAADEGAGELCLRLEAEAELRRSQRVQLDAAVAAVDRLRSQLVEARRGNADLRGALERHQELLFWLQGCQ